MHVEIRFHSDHIAPNDLAIFKALAALAEFAPDAPLPTVEDDHGEPLRPEPTPPVEVKPARPAARKAPAAKPAPAPEPAETPTSAPAPAPEPTAPVVAPEPEPTETKLAAAKRELTEEVTKLARSGPEGRARAKKALISAGVERVSEVKTLTVAKAVLAALAEGDEADDLT